MTPLSNVPLHEIRISKARFFEALERHGLPVAARHSDSCPSYRTQSQIMEPESPRWRDHSEQLRQQHPQPSAQPAAEPDADDMSTKRYNTHARAWAVMALAQGVRIHGSNMEGLANFHASIPEAGRPSLNWLKEVINDGRKMIPTPPLDAK